MTSESALPETTPLRWVIRELQCHGWTLKTSGAAFGLCGGILAPLFGSILTGIALLSGPTWHGYQVQRDGTVLLFLTIPLLSFGAHCLDLLDREKNLGRKAPLSDINNERSTKEGKSDDLGRDKECS